MVTWEQELPLMRAVVEEWTAELARTSPAPRGLAAELHPDSAPRGPWSWFLWLELDGLELQAFLSWETGTATFEDAEGWFEDRVSFADVPEYVRRRRA